MFVDKKSSEQRLLAYYRNLYGIENFPAKIKIADYGEYEKILNLMNEEYLINIFHLTSDMDLIVSSQRLLFKSTKIVWEINYEKVIAVFIKFPYKNTDSHKTLTVLSNDAKAYFIGFKDLKTLTDARNEIYRVINTVLRNWSGNKFIVKDFDMSNFEEIAIP
jgi:hypothetical protein